MPRPFSHAGARPRWDSPACPCCHLSVAGDNWERAGGRGDAAAGVWPLFPGGLRTCCPTKPLVPGGREERAGAEGLLGAELCSILGAEWIPLRREASLSSRTAGQAAMPDCHRAPVCVCAAREGLAVQNWGCVCPE